MMSGNLNSFRKRSVGLDLNQAFTEEDEEEEKAEEKVKEEEEESEKEEEEDKEKEQNRIPKELNDREEEEEEEEGGVLSKKEQRTENHMKNQVGFLPDPCLVSDLKLRGNQGECNALFHNECMLKDGLDLSLEGKKQNYEEIESSSSRGPPDSSNKFSQKKGCFTNDLELCEKQGDFLPKGPLMDGLKVRENQGESSVIPEKEYNFRDGLNLNLDERNYDGTLEGLVVEAKGSSLSPVPPSHRGRYLSTVTHDDFQVSGHRTLPHQRSPERMSSYHYTLNQSHSPIRDSFSGRHIEHNLLRSPREPSSRMHIERDISRSPTDTFSRGQIGQWDSFSRKHIELELPPRSPKGSFSRRFIERDLLKSPRARLIERDHSRSPRDFPHTRRYRELSPPSVSPQTRRRYMRGSYSRTPPRGYCHSPR